MYKVEIWNKELCQVVEIEEHALLLSVLREAGQHVYAPCGGNGTCGKCKVWINGEAKVLTPSQRWDRLDLDDPIKTVKVDKDYYVGTIELTDIERLN